MPALVEVGARGALVVEHDDGLARPAVTGGERDEHRGGVPHLLEGADAGLSRAHFRRSISAQEQILITGMVPSAVEPVTPHAPKRVADAPPAPTDLTAVIEAAHAEAGGARGSPVGEGFAQRFERGELTWSPQHGAH